MIKTFLKNSKKIVIFGAIALIVLGAGVFLRASGKWGGMSSKIAADRSLKFINANVLAGQASASLISIKDSSGLYKVTVKINEEDFDTYITKDGKYFFAEGYDLDRLAEEEAKKNREIPKTDKPVVQLFVMAYCPYGNQAEKAIIPVAKLLGDSATVEMHYVIYGNYNGGGEDYCLDKENKYCSMHGIDELKQDIRELCVQKYEKDKLFSFIEKINQENENGADPKTISSKWEAIARSLGINTEKIKTCAQNEAVALLENEVKLNQEFGVEGSPMLLINGVNYAKDRTSEGYKNAICSGMNNPSDKCSVKLDENAAAAQGDCGN